MDNPISIIVNGEVAYRYVENHYYYITKSGILYSVYKKGGHGSYDINTPHKVAYGQDKDGYYRCVLSLNGTHKHIKIHQMMAIQFLGHKQYENNLVVNHIDGNKQNNLLENLELVTIKENCNHAWRTGLSSKANHPFTTKVDVIDNLENVTYHFNSIQEVRDSDLPIDWRYIKYIKDNQVNFNLCSFIKIKTGDGRFDYKIECYYNGMLYMVFKNYEEAGKYFKKPPNSVCSAIRSKYSKKVNRYTIIFP